MDGSSSLRPAPSSILRRAPSRLPLALACAWACGCGGAWPEVDNPRWVNSIGAPRIHRVRDLGTRVPPQAGVALSGESDGVASPGEYLLIEGSGFGKSPAVTVDGRSAEVVARTVGAGIVARVPGGVGVGPRPVEVAVGEGRSRVPFALRRLAVTLHAGTLTALAIDGETVKPWGAPLSLPGATALAEAHDGSYAYVLAGSKLLVIDLGAAGGPKWVASRDVRVAATALVAALRAPRVIAVADGEAQIFETSDPRAPAPYQNTPLPPEARGAVRVDVAPDGQRLGFLIPEGNRVAVVDIASPPRPRLLGDAFLLPEARVALVRDLRFAPDGEYLYVVSGDGPGSAAVGKQPTRLSVVRLERPEGGGATDVTVSAWRTGQLAAAWAPLRLSAARVSPLASGASIRLPPERTPVRFSTVDGAVFTAGASSPAGSFEQGDGTGESLRLAEPHLVVGPSAGAPDDRSAVALAARCDGGKSELGVLVVTLSQPPTHAFTALGPASPADCKPPLAVGEIVLQP